MTDWLSTGSNAATILTATVATASAAFYIRERRLRRKKLEHYLKHDDWAARLIPHLMAECRMTESQLFEAALASSHVRVWNGVDDEGEATNAILFSYDRKGRAKKGKSN